MAIWTPSGLPVAAVTAAWTTGELAATSATDGFGSVVMVGWVVAGTWAVVSDGVGDGVASSAGSSGGMNCSMKGPGGTSVPAGPSAGRIAGAEGGHRGAGGTTGAGCGTLVDRSVRTGRGGGCRRRRSLARNGRVRDRHRIGPRLARGGIARGGIARGGIGRGSLHRGNRHHDWTPGGNCIIGLSCPAPEGQKCRRTEHRRRGPHRGRARECAR